MTHIEYLELEQQREIKMTPERWRRLQDARRLADMHHAALADHSRLGEGEIVDRLGQAEFERLANEVPADMRIHQHRIVGLDEASELTPEFLREFSDVLIAQDIAPDADALQIQRLPGGGSRYRFGRFATTRLQGRPVTGREILERQRNANTAPVIFGPPDPQDVEADFYKNKLGREIGGSLFDRWFDLHDSNVELEAFLFKCWKYGKQFEIQGGCSVGELEENENG